MSKHKETLNNGNLIWKEKKQRFRDLIKGVLVAIRISRARRYPTTLTFYDFLHLFGALAPEVLEGNYDEKVACQKILDKKIVKGYKIGKTKIFLRAGQIVELDARRAEAAREIGVLKEAKEKLERRLEELTWNLQLEKQLRIDLEEAKAQEIRALQDALHAMQSQLEEANSRVIKEQEAAQRAIEDASLVIEKTPVLIQDTGKVDSTIVEVVSFKEFLIKNISLDMGFSDGRPIAACVIYKCLLHWGSFTVEKTNVFDCIIQTFSSALEDKDDNGVLSCWLSHSSALLWLLLQTLKTSGDASLTQPSFLQGLRAFPRRVGYSFLSLRMLNGLDVFRFEAKLPALLFKQQLTDFFEKIYGIIRDNLESEISSLLRLCIQSPRTSRARLVKGSHWQSIVKILNSYLRTLRDNYVAPFLVREMFIEIFSFINVKLFNSILLRRECCSFSYGEYVKTGLADLEQWCIEATQEYVGSAWDELKHLRQAIEFLILPRKQKKSLNAITTYHCPVLSIEQICGISKKYHDEKYGTESVSAQVISRMRVRTQEDTYKNVSYPYFLDYDDSIIPFCVDDFSKSMPWIEIGDINPPPLIGENSLLVLLLRHTE